MQRKIFIGLKQRTPNKTQMSLFVKYDSDWDENYFEN